MLISLNTGLILASIVLFQAIQIGAHRKFIAPKRLDGYLPLEVDEEYPKDQPYDDLYTSTTKHNVWFPEAARTSKAAAFKTTPMPLMEDPTESWGDEFPTTASKPVKITAKPSTSSFSPTMQTSETEAEETKATTKAPKTTATTSTTTSTTKRKTTITTTTSETTIATTTTTTTTKRPSFIKTTTGLPNETTSPPDHEKTSPEIDWWMIGFITGGVVIIVIAIVCFVSLKLPKVTKSVRFKGLRSSRKSLGGKNSQPRMVTKSKLKSKRRSTKSVSWSLKSSHSEQASQAGSVVSGASRVSGASDVSEKGGKSTSGISHASGLPQSTAIIVKKPAVKSAPMLSAIPHGRTMTIIQSRSSHTNLHSGV